jgi:hypothetical protein
MNLGMPGTRGTRARGKVLGGKIHVMINHLLGDGMTLMALTAIVQGVMAATRMKEEGSHINDFLEEDMQVVVEQIL